MEIIYLISVAVLFIVFILAKKTEKKINIISFICISVVTLFSYNAFVCYILTFFTIPITLWILASINLIITLLLGIKIIKDKEIQKYIFNKLDIIYIFIIALVVLIVSYINFGFPFDVNYETGDPSVHYLTSVMFAESDSLLPGAEKDEIYGSLDTRKTVSYVNSGLLMKCLCENLEPIECYNVFVVFGILILFLTGITLYSAMTHYAQKKEHRFWAFILSSICILGYPLNSFLFGFEYLSMGLLVICAIINLIYYYEKDIIYIKYFIPIMALLNFGLFSSYFMFVPFVYSALWIYFYIKNYQRTKKVITKEIIILWSVTLLIPFILGYIYHLKPEVYAILINSFANSRSEINQNIINIANQNIVNQMDYSVHILKSGFAVDGYIYINLYSNMLLLVPLPIYLLLKDAKNNKLKDNAFIYLLLFFTIVFIEILLIGNKLGKVSIYYLSKNYFALWIILFYFNYKVLIILSKKSKYIPRIFIGAYVILMVICTIFSNVNVGYFLNNPYEKISSVMEIFGANKTILLEKPKEFTQEELEILEYARKNLDYNLQIEVVTDENAYYWQYVLLRYVNKEEMYKNIPGNQLELTSKWQTLENKINKVDYMIYFNKTDKYNELEDKLFENSEIIYENSSGGILKYKN